MGSGIIYAVVAVIWIAYFVPAWLRRHDEVSESKSVERYRDAMRVVARGTGAEVSVTVSERVEARKTMLRRRQQIFTGIIGMLILTVGLSMFSLVTPWIVALPVITFALYLAYVRRAKVAEELVMRREVIRAAHNLEVTVRPSTLSFAKTIQEPTLTLPAVSTGVHVIERRESAWEPAKVPVPTYVTAPKAVRAHRVIDLTKPGSWTAEQQAEEASRLSAIAPSRDEVFDQVAADAAATEMSARAANQ
ncbi:MAG TPA: hypothetical protein VMV52_04270 [Candidatus Nanopelagicaceae bacterium]|nr:hypothetical protein [Candidatus Nanopelagicaceae bacterium]